MTEVEAELIQATQATWGNVISLTVVQISLLSGYLITAYLAGKNLTRAQVVIVNGLYLLMSAFVLMSIFTLSNRATEMATIAIEMSSDRGLTPQHWLPLGVIVIFSVCLLSSLKFMWDVRHSKTE